MSFDFNVLHNKRPGFSKGQQPGGGDEKFPVQLASIAAVKRAERPTKPPPGLPPFLAGPTAGPKV